MAGNIRTGRNSASPKICPPIRHHLASCEKLSHKRYSDPCDASIVESASRKQSPARGVPAVTATIATRTKPTGLGYVTFSRGYAHDAVHRRRGIRSPAHGLGTVWLDAVGSSAVATLKQSPPATCTRLLGNWLIGYHCGAEMQLVVTKNPISTLPYEELIVTRCGAGHIATSDGVLL